MSNIDTQLLQPDASGLDQAVQILQAGGLVAMPTETVYGLAGDARNDHAVARIFAAKGRPHFNPLIVHVQDLEQAQKYAHFDTNAMALALAFWPGALTLVLPLRLESGLAPLVTAGLDTVALRVPSHQVARDLLAHFDGPLAAPSANPSGRISPTRVQHVVQGLWGRIDAILEGGAALVGVESTIIGLSYPPLLLRPGGVSADQIEHVLNASIATIHPQGAIVAPGQLASHYAPNAAVRLGVMQPLVGEIWVGFGPDCGGAALNLSPSADLVEAAANLFHLMREADLLAKGQAGIAFAPIPSHGLGAAINDRLSRSAAPRPKC